MILKARLCTDSSLLERETDIDSVYFTHSFLASQTYRNHYPTKRNVVPLDGRYAESTLLELLFYLRSVVLANWTIFKSSHLGFLLSYHKYWSKGHLLPPGSDHPLAFLLIWILGTRFYCHPVAYTMRPYKRTRLTRRNTLACIHLLWYRTLFQLLQIGSFYQQGSIKTRWTPFTWYAVRMYACTLHITRPAPKSVNIDKQRRYDEQEILMKTV